ncbi:hypothetical protein DQ04_03031030 [Trypanosoma grayi]|uniref:hypothetical protein n=1 Tax=Trypanosoma grayi TaxID=71804 RepID=UPI0004F474C7|nr:hypothetical protein DQ04_03031030 [Trypanosoma grayi]KEG11045.1 hypothetical protein DQ04_03031030 [Trypanosoma grayi]
MRATSTELQCRLGELTMERDELRASMAELHSCLSEVTADRDEPGAGLFGFEDSCGQVGSNDAESAGAVGFEACGSLKEKSPLELLASDFVVGVGGGVDDAGNSWKLGLELDVRERYLEERFSRVREKERKLLALARRLRVAHAELKRGELLLRSSQCDVSEESCEIDENHRETFSGENNRWHSDVVGISKRDRDSVSGADASEQQKLVRATELYRDLLYEHILDESGVSGSAAVRESSGGETAVEKTVRMLSELERLCGSPKCENNGCVSFSTQDSEKAFYRDYSERCLQAFRRLEKAMEALS